MGEEDMQVHFRNDLKQAARRIIGVHGTVDPAGTKISVTLEDAQRHICSYWARACDLLTDPPRMEGTRRVAVALLQRGRLDGADIPALMAVDSLVIPPEVIAALDELKPLMLARGSGTLPSRVNGFDLSISLQARTP
jgi:hypothetical protein